MEFRFSYLMPKRLGSTPIRLICSFSKDRIERGAVVNLFTLVRFSERLARRQTWKERESAILRKWARASLRWRRPSKRFEMGPRRSMVRVYARWPGREREPLARSHASGCALALPASGPARCASLLGGLGGGPGGGMEGGWGGAWAHGRGRPRRRARCGEREREPLARSRASGCALALPASGPARVRSRRVLVSRL